MPTSTFFRLSFEQASSKRNALFARKAKMLEELKDERACSNESLKNGSGEGT